MSETPTLSPLRAAALVLVEVNAGRATIPPDVERGLRDAVAAAAPGCTPEQIANNECPTA